MIWIAIFFIGVACIMAYLAVLCRRIIRFRRLLKQMTVPAEPTGFPVMQTDQQKQPPETV